MVENQQILADSRWVRRFVPAPDAAVRLICLPHAGGSAPFFLPFARALADRFDVVAVQYPGRQDRRLEPCVTDLAALADQVFVALRCWLDRPVALFGHSMGATLGFEVGRRIEAESDTRLLRLFASGRRAPSTYREGAPVDLDEQAALDEMLMLSGTDARLLSEPEVMKMVVPALQADFRAAESYRLREHAALRCPITVLTGDDDPRVTLDEARAWQRHTSAFEMIVYPGGHFFLTDHQAAVTALIAARLADVM